MEKSYFEILNPDVIGNITQYLQPKYTSKLKQTSKSINELVKSTYNFDPQIVNVSQKRGNTIRLIYQSQSKNIAFDFYIILHKGEDRDYLDNPKKFKHDLTLFLDNQLNSLFYNVLFDDHSYFKYNDIYIKKYDDNSLIYESKHIKSIISSKAFTLTLQSMEDKIRLEFVNFHMSYVKNIIIDQFKWIPALEEIEKYDIKRLKIILKRIKQRRIERSQRQAQQN